MKKVIRSIKSQYDFIPVVIKHYVMFLDASGMQSEHASDVLHDQIFRDYMTNFCAMRHISFNRKGNGTHYQGN